MSSTTSLRSHLREEHESSSSSPEEEEGRGGGRGRGREESNEDKEPLQTEIYWLSLLLLFCLMPSRDSHSLFIHFNRCVCFLLLVSAVGTVVYIPLTQLEENGVLMVLGRVLFTVYTSTMYTYMSCLVRRDPGLLSHLREIGRIERAKDFAYPCDKEHPMKVIIGVMVVLILTNVVLGAINPTAIFGDYGRGVLVFLQICFFFLSIGWQIAIPFVFVGCRSLTMKIKYLTSYVHTEFQTNNNDTEAPIDVVFLMDWYDELYEKNRLLNEMVSGVVTITITFLALATTLIALNAALNGMQVQDIFWFLANGFMLFVACYPAGELEIQNAHLNIELGTLPVSGNLTNLNLFLNQYQSCTIKTSRSEFGIFVLGTKIRITFGELIRIGSVTLSAIIFLGSVVRS